MEISRFVKRSTISSVVAACVVVSASGCSSNTSGGGDEIAVDAPKTPAAIFDAQSRLYGALFEDPPDIDSAVLLMSASCQEDSSDSTEVIAVLLDEVELAQSADLSEESVLNIFSEISYTIEDDSASGDDGSEWVYENGDWRSTDC